MNRYSFFYPAEEQRNQLEQDVHGRIRAALQTGQFCLHYQPKVDMRSGRVIGVEALARWQHPEQGLLLPGAFLPFIEGHELIVELGNWVLAEALRQMRAWRQVGIDLEVSVNIAPCSCSNPTSAPSCRPCWPNSRTSRPSVWNWKSWKARPSTTSCMSAMS